MTDNAHRVVRPGEFEAREHFYPRVLNAQIHPLVRYFMDLGNERIAERYCHLHPEASAGAVRAALGRHMRYFRWGGADLFTVTDEKGRRQLVVIETNSCPSGQKSIPLLHEREEQAGYRVLVERAFLPLMQHRRGLPQGEVAVIFDKNPMEASGYAAVLADALGGPVHLVSCHSDAPEPLVRVHEDVLSIHIEGIWTPVRAALRYVTQRPWNRIPPLTRTSVFNPVLVCLAGGRNKMLAAKAYDMFNAGMYAHGLAIRSPETIWDVTLEQVPLWVARMGGVAVIKVPYSNAGQGVYTITNPGELDAFMAIDHGYERFIVQSLIGNVGWSSLARGGRLYHVGTVPNKHGQIYVADLRFMVGSGPGGCFPVAIYARRARQALVLHLADGPPSSWDMLGTNLSVRREDGSWDTESDRLLLMDSRDFNRLGIGLDDLIEAYLQTVMAVTAIDDMAANLVTKKGRFRKRLFRSLNPDPVLLDEIRS